MGQGAGATIFALEMKLYFENGRNIFIVPNLLASNRENPFLLFCTTEFLESPCHCSLIHILPTMIANLHIENLSSSRHCASHHLTFTIISWENNVRDEETEAQKGLQHAWGHTASR